MSIVTKGYGKKSFIVTRGYGPAVLFAEVRKIFKRNIEVLFPRDLEYVMARRKAIENHYYVERDTYNPREPIEKFFYAAKCDERK